MERRDETLKKLSELQGDGSLQMLSTSGLGQNPYKPSTAQERAEKIEDRAVRQGIERLKKRHGDGNDSSDSDEPRGKGKGRAVEVVDIGADDQEAVTTTRLETAAERKAREKAEGRGRSGKIAMPRKANWNPKAASAAAEASSSDFNSSDSDDDSDGDSQPVGGPSRSSSPPADAAPRPPTTVGSALKGAPVGGALKSSSGSALRSSAVGSALETAVGGALKMSANGSAFQPRVVLRGPKKFAPARRRDEESESEEEGESSEYDGSDDDEEMDSNDDGNEDEDGEVEAGDESEEDAEDSEQPKKSRGFKDWAQQQMGTKEVSLAPDLLSTTAPGTTPKPSKPIPKTGEFVGPLGAAMSVLSSSLLDGAKEGSTSRPKLNRRPSVAEARMELPILAEEQGIVEAVLMHPVVLICGETGSGKTTQVPQMLYEAGFGFPGSDNPGMVAVTQPRRVAAVSLAERVRDELGLDAKSGVVAHQIRYSSTTAKDTAIKFMTDGVLLRELATDFLLSRYSVVVIDEAHERGVNTDVLVGVLSRVAKLREKKWREGGEGRLSPLRLVIMSATLRVADFAENATLFSTPPPIIHIGARQHPVTVHFSRRTTNDYVGEAFKKVSKIHSRLPPGTILVFLTGQGEIMSLCRKLEAKYGKKGKGKGRPVSKTIETGMLPPETLEAEDVDLGGDQDLAGDVDDGVAEEDPEALDTEEEEDAAPDLELEESDTPMTVLPLYSLLPQDQQMAVFKPPPEGHRLVIVSTNVAETSLTIPGVRYVVDSGRAKERQYDHASGVQNFAVSWISKASAAQRAGRAGRTGPGHCYRLYSSALYEDHFPAFSEPEILRMPIEGVVLNMKAMNIDAVVNFPFPTPPDRQALRRAESLLQHLGALEKPVTTRMVAGVQQKGAAGGRITDLGRSMAAYPVSPRFAKMLVVGAQNDCLSYVIAIVAGMSVGDPFVHENALDVNDEDEDDMDSARAAELAGIRSEEVREKERRKDLRSKFFKRTAAFDGKGESDMFKLLAAIGAYEHSPTSSFCNEYFLRHKAMQEIQQLRGQIANIAKAEKGKLTPPDDKTRKMLRQILTAGFIDQVAVLESIALKRGGSAHASTRGIPYRALGVPEPVYIHPSSVLFHHTPPEYLVFTEVVRTSRVYVKGNTRIQPSWLAVLGKDMCTFSRPVEAAGAKSKLSADGNERDVIVIPHFGDLGVDLPPIKRKQRREGTRWIMLE